MKQVPIADAFFQGAISLQHGRGWTQPWRLPHGLRALFCSPSDTLVERAGNPAGVRLRFATKSRTLCLLCAPHPEDRRFDLVMENELAQTAAQRAKSDRVTFEGLPKGRKTLEIWLPQRSGAVRVKGLAVDAGACAVPVPDRRFRWVTYGSSITHCATAHSPARTWPGVVARTKDWNLTCLGLGGNCHLEPMWALTIRDLPADFISLKLGINVMGGGSLNNRTFQAAVIGFIRIIREKHPTTPLAVISPICSPPRETTDNAVGLCLTKMREQIEDAVARIKKTCGDRNTRYISGLRLFDESLAPAYLPDNLHPNGNGYEILARNFLRHVVRPMGL